MLSKKMAFSLTSLITIFALAFVAPSAMAGEFGVTMSIDPDLDRSAEGGTQVYRDWNVAVRVEFAKVVKTGPMTEAPAFSASDITVIAYNEFGGIETSPMISEPADYDGRNPDGMNFVVVVSGVDGTNATRVLLYMDKHAVEVADPRADLDAGVRTVDGKSAEASIEIHYVDGDRGNPQVYSIRRANDPLLPATSETVQVVIRLSEQPVEFTKDDISVTKATHVDPVALVAQREDSVGVAELEGRLIAEWLEDNPAPGEASLYDIDEDADADVEASTGIHAALRTNADLMAAYTAYNAIQDGTDLDITDLSVEAPTEHELPIHRPFRTTAGIDNDTAIVGSAVTLTAEMDADEIEEAIAAEEVGQDRTTDPGSRPSPASFADQVEYRAALTFYDAQIARYNAYQAELALHQAYLAAVNVVRQEEMDAMNEHRNMRYDALLRALADEYAGQVIPRDTPLPATGRDRKLYSYVLTITPDYKTADDIVVRVKMFEDMRLPNPGRYYPPRTDAAYREGIDQLTIKVKANPPVKTAGVVAYIPENTIIPKDGYLVVAKNAAGSAVRDPGGSDKSPLNTDRQPFGLTYNRVEGGLVNLETLLINGGTIDIIGPAKLVISEIMWGSDASLDPDDANSQYIELRNTSGAEIKAAKETYSLVFYSAGAGLPDMSVAANNVQDRAGTVGAHGFWTAKGQSGRTGVGEAPGDQVAITPTQEIVSMQRVIDATGVAADGTDPMSWGASKPPGLNFDPAKEGKRYGSPGTAPIDYPDTPTPDEPETTVPVAMPEDIVITEIMVDSGDGRLPQWIELSNVSGAEVSLAGWSVDISNDAADADAVGSSVSINLSGTLGVSAHAGNTGKGQTLVLVAWSARSSSNLGADRIMNVSSQVGEAGRYTLISEMAFMVALVPPQATGVLTYGDTVGNLDAAEAWEIPTSEGARSSLIRREMDKDSMATMGTSASGWVMASSTPLVSGPVTWYGSDEDAGTPGYDAGGPLPVELSMFYPARDKLTGAVVIKWETQSELNNAGFFIKRSQQRNTNFKVINAAMIPGAGTISEKQSYTYTDMTAQPNVVYYYQIEDVSLDGNRQQLTRGIRLRGHIGAAGKATTLWGELKTSQ